MTQSQNISATYTRTKETMKKYIQVFQQRKESTKKHNPFEHALENPKDQIIVEFKHWFIMKNDFPYDAIAEINHMIVTKRAIPFDWKLLHQEEKKEFQKLRETYLKDHYDVIYENLPSGQTQSGWFHIHLLKLKRTSLEKFMNS